MNEQLILGNNGDKYMVVGGNLLMNGHNKLCPTRTVPCGTECMHLNHHNDGTNRFALMTCTGIIIKIRLMGGTI